MGLKNKTMRGKARKVDKSLIGENLAGQQQKDIWKFWNTTNRKSDFHTGKSTVVAMDGME